MEIHQIAERLADLCRQGQWPQAQEELYSDDVVSIEPPGAPVERIQGREALKAKGQEWAGMVEEVHGVEVSEPHIADSFISYRMKVDTTMKGMGRQQMEEICVYKVADGKIVSEQFFYTPYNPAAAQ